MTIKSHFDLYGLNGALNNNEKQLVKDLVAESIQMMGMDITYMPRTLQKEDSIFGEDVLSSFTTTYTIEMYLENVDGFEGENEFLQKFGLTVNDKATLIVSSDRFTAVTGMTKPLEGDLLYFPLSGGIFEIKFVQDEKQFYPNGTLPQYKLDIELFVYSAEDIDTGITAIDDVILHSGEEDITNLIIYSRDFSQWTMSGTPLLANTGIGYNGNAEAAYKVTDDDPAVVEGLTSNIVAIPAENTIPYLGYVFIQKDTDETRFPVLSMSFSGGGAINPAVMINTKTGDSIFTNTGNVATKGVIDFDRNYWLVWIVEYNDSTATALSQKIFPAFSTTWGTQEISAEGSITIDQSQIESGVIEPSIQVETNGTIVTLPFVPDKLGDNKTIESEADLIRDFSEDSPFGDY